MQRRSLLKFGGAASIAASVASVGCGGSGNDGDSGPFATIRGTTRSIRYDAQGNAIEWSSDGHWVRYYDTSNQLQWSFDGVGTQAGSLNAPSGAVAVGERIYVSDFGNSRVVVLNMQGSLLFTFGEAGSDPDDLLFVHEPVPGPDDQLYFCDALHHRVQVYNRDGVWQRSVGGFGLDGAGLNYPESLAFDADGLLHVVDSGNCRVVVYSAAGSMVRFYGTRGTGPGQMINPEGIAIDRNGHVYVSDRGQHMVHVFDRQGRYMDRLPVLHANGDYVVPGEMNWAPDGALLVSGRPDASRGLIPRQFL